MAKVVGEDLDLLKSLLSYEPESGRLIWKREYRGAKAGSEAGYTRGDGTRLIWFGDKERSVGPICWALHHGEWPKGRVRFKEAKTDFRIENLYCPSGNWHSRENRREYEKERRGLRPELYRNNDLKKDFGIGIKEYAEMLDAQNGVCAICARPETAIRNGKIKMLAVDHCHTSDAIRGLLCTKCNVMVGMSEDHPERLRAAADYIQKHAGKIVSIRKDTA